MKIFNMNALFQIIHERLFNAEIRSSELVLSIGLMEVFRYGGRFLFWFSKGEVLARMPKAFEENCRECRVIIDASESEIEIPGSTERNVNVYSSYKSKTTIKWLIGMVLRNGSNLS